MRWLALILGLLFAAAPLGGQLPPPPTVLAWNAGEPTHLATTTWEVETASGIVPCGSPTLTTEWRCTATFPRTTTQQIRLRGTNGSEVGAWSTAVTAPAIPAGQAPGTLTITWAGEVEGGGGTPMAIAFANVSSEGKLEPSGDPETTAHTIASTLTDGYVIVGIAGWDSSSYGATTATFDSVSMAELAAVQRAAFGGNYFTRLFGLAIGNKASGTYDAVVNLLSTADEYNAVVLTYTGVHQTTPVGTAVTANGNSAAPSVNVSSASGELVVDVVTLGGNSGAVGSGQTQRWLQATSTGGGASEEAGAATVTMSWSQASADWTIAAVPLKPAAGGAPSAPFPPFARRTRFITRSRHARILPPPGLPGFSRDPVTGLHLPAPFAALLRKAA